MRCLTRTLPHLRFILLFLLLGGGALRAQPTTRLLGKGQFAFVHRLDRTPDGRYTLVVDYAELLTGAEAERAAAQDGEPFPTGFSGHYIRNRTRSLRTLMVAPYAQIYLLQQMTPTLVKLATFHQLLQGEASSFGAFNGFPHRCDTQEDSSCLPVRIVQRGGWVVRIEQVYLR